MGLCFSCSKSKDRFKVKGSKLCSQIQSAVVNTSPASAPASAPSALAPSLPPPPQPHSKSALHATPIDSTVQTTQHAICQRFTHQYQIYHQHHYLYQQQQQKFYSQTAAGAVIATPSSLDQSIETTSPPLAPLLLSNGGRMATSFPNMNITNPIKGLVSKNKNRYKKDGFNLDLTYITPNIIAMGFPASSIEGVYRNHIDDVVSFFETKHKDHYYIYNLCSERSYDKTKFHNRVMVFPFDDHNPPRIEAIAPFCNAVGTWLSRDAQNVAAVHCKAGKGRTGTMICCYLMHSGLCRSAGEALAYYGQKRTQDHKGVTIPSQVRYVNYYERLLRHQLTYAPVSMYIKEFRLCPAPCLAGGHNHISFTISHHQYQQPPGGGDDAQSPTKYKKLKKHDTYEVKKNTPGPFSMRLNYCLLLRGDVRVVFYKSKIRGREKLFQFWFNTFFVRDRLDRLNGCAGEDGGGASEVVAGGTAPAPPPSGNEYVLVLSRNELDIINKKDKQNKIFSPEFKLVVILEKIPAEHNFSQSFQRSLLPTCQEQGTPSESSVSSDDSTNEEDDWDSELNLLS